MNFIIFLVLNCRFQGNVVWLKKLVAWIVLDYVFIFLNDIEGIQDIDRVIYSPLNVFENLIFIYCSIWLSKVIELFQNVVSNLCARHALAMFQPKLSNAHHYGFTELKQFLTTVNQILCVVVLQLWHNFFWALLRALVL